jgi:crotonobetainyl-CoA:carnitine CoA-transferase CaiB-like acyl-CoA transferase
MILAIGNDSQFASFCRVAGCAEWAADPRFTTNSARVANRVELLKAIRQLASQRTTEEWVGLLERANVPCGPINTLEQVFADPQVRFRELKLDIPHPALGTVPTVASPLRLSKTPVRYRNAAPALGADTTSVLASLSTHQENPST